MTISMDDRPDLRSPQEPVPAGTAATPWLFVAGVASLGAGAIHAAAAGAHGEHPAAVVVFLGLAVAQLVWGGAALVRRDRVTADLGILLAGGAVLGWALAKTIGLPFVPGLQVPEAVQFADVSAAVLALVAGVLAALATREGSPGLRLPAWVMVACVVAFSLAGSVATSGHHHDEGVEGHVHGTVAHGAGAAHAGHPVPYDPNLPIDLSGTAGVSPRQQAAAENLIAVTLVKLPQWSNPAVAVKAGFRSIGDGFTGVEHFINQKFLDDGVTLDPDRPESLVYDTTGGGRRLVAAMYMLSPGTPLSAVPPLGGALVQWHTHENLCFSRAGFISGLTDAAGRCTKGLVKPISTPMVHVWITPNPCGPFAALEGIGGGHIEAGQTRLCDHLHGSAA